MDSPDSALLTSLESTLLKKIEEINAKMEEEKNAERLQSLGATLSALLENLKKTRKMRRT